MLQKITIENFALFEKIECCFSAGMNIISGETGAGKTILIEALNAVLGGKVSGDYIRTNAKCFIIEAVFSELSPKALELLLANGIAADSGTVVITRRYSQGKSEQTVNGVRLSLPVLKLIAQNLLDLHGQHDHQALLREQTHREIIDSYNPQITGVQKDYAKEYVFYKSQIKQLADYDNLSKNAAQRSAILSWQIREISEAILIVGEEEELDEQGKLLANAEKIANAAGHCYLMLNGSKNDGAVGKLYSAKQDIETLARYYPKIGIHFEAVSTAALALEDLSEIVRDIGNGVEFNQSKLDKCYNRLEEIKKLKLKYGASIQEILQFKTNAERELGEIENIDEQIADCREAIASSLERLGVIADELSELRQKAAEKFSTTLSCELNELAMVGGRLRAEITQLPEFTETGRDSIEIMFSANVGEPVKPLSKVASGGELSRIALAIKAQPNISSDASTVVFDEIDTGVGGKTALVVAAKLKKIAASRQVLCITHLAQIAAIADRQFLLKKTVDKNRTTSCINELSETGRTAEIARMLAGTVNEKSLAMAEELIAKAEEV